MTGRSPGAHKADFQGVDAYTSTLINVESISEGRLSALEHAADNTKLSIRSSGTKVEATPMPDITLPLNMACVPVCGAESLSNYMSELAQMQPNIREDGTPRSASSGRTDRPSVFGRARGSSMRGDRKALSATSVVLVGPSRWRVAVDGILAGNDNLAVAADVEGDPREVDIYSIPQGDVILIAADGERPNDAVEFALRLQSKDRGTGIALVLPNMSYKNLRGFHTYAGSWSLISAAACGDPARLSAVLESSGRGIPWVDTAISRLLKVFDQGTVDFDEEFDDDAISDLVRKPEPLVENGSGSAVDQAA